MATRLETEAFEFYEKYRQKGMALSSDAELLRKLGEEFGELAEAIVNGAEKEICYEAADIHLILIDLLMRKGKSLSVCSGVKLDIVKERWANINK